MSGTVDWMPGENVGWMEEEKVAGNAPSDHELVLIGSAELFHATSNDVEASGSAFRMVWALTPQAAARTTQQKSINSLA